MALSKMFGSSSEKTGSVPSTSFFGELSGSISKFSKAISNITSVSQKISDHLDDLKPSVTDASSSFVSTCSALNKVLDKIGSLIEPFLKAYSFLATMYKSIKDMVLRLFESLSNKVRIGFQWVLEKSEDVDIVVYGFLVFAITLLVLLCVCPSDIIEGVSSTIKNIFLIVGNMFSSLYNLDWFPKWAEKFTMVAQASMLPGESVSHTPTSQLMSTIMAFGISTLVFIAVPGRPNGLSNPLSKILYSTGSGAQQCNQLFTLYRNMKDCTSQAFSWVLEIIVGAFGFKNPVLSAISATLSTDLFEWMQEVDAVCDPATRLENFANKAFPDKLNHLREQALKISAYIATHPVAAFMSHRVSAAITQLEKVYAESCRHVGVGQYRIEPFMVQWYGASGCGKSTAMRLFINDVLDRMGEPKLNRLYAVSKRDAYWSNYAHQTAVLMDDMGALRDGAGQCQDIKDLIDIKSTQPAPLPMAAVEDKGRHFTSKYIFATSNLVSAPAQCGLTYPDAFERRRDILVECIKEGEFSTEDPTGHLMFNIVESRRPHAITHRHLSYSDLLDYVVAKCQVHAEISKQLFEAETGISNKTAQVAVSSEEVVASVDGARFKTKQDVPIVTPTVITEEDRVIYSKELTVEALKFAYQGSLDPESLFPHDYQKQALFDSLDAEHQQVFMRWMTDMIYKGANAEQYRWLVQNIPDDYLMHFKSFIYASTICEKKLAVQTEMRTGFAHNCIDADVDTLICIQQMPPFVQFLYTAFVRYWCTKVSKEAKDSWVKICYHKIVDYMKETWWNLPYALRLLIKAGLIIMALNGLFGGITAFLACWQSNSFPSASGRGGVTNESNSISSKKNKGPSRLKNLLVGQSSANITQEWAAEDGFVNQALKKNMIVLRLGEGVYFRGTYVCSGWIMTVAHAFHNVRDGTPFTIIHPNSRSKVQYNARESKVIEGQDIILLRVGDPDGPKPDIRKHFPRRDEVCFTKGSQGLCCRAVASTDPRLGNLEFLKFPVMMSKGYTVKVEYELDSASFKLSSQQSYEYHMNGENGDCGTLLLLPSVQNKQPVIVGIHCASYDGIAAEKGFISSNATAIFRDQLENLPTGPVKAAMVRCDILKAIRSRETTLFEENQVSFLGTVPQELAATVPHKTTLRKSQLFEAFGPAETAPSILTVNDKRGEGFDPYVAGVMKYNETAHGFDDDIAKLSFETLKSSLLPTMKNQKVPGGKPQERDEDVVLNGIDGCDYYDGMELSTSCGYPFNKMGMGMNKREFVVPTGEGDKVELRRDTPVFEAWEELDIQIRQGIHVDLITTQCAKDERLPLEKIYGKRKTRLFEILPFHYNMLVRKYFLDFSATLMALHNVIPCKVGIDPTSSEWSLLANNFRAVSDTGFSADYSSFDGRAPVFAFQWFCDLVDEYYDTKPGEPASNARHALLMMASCHYTLCEDKVFRLVGGMPSGFALTVIFNSLLNEFYMRYAFISLLRRPHIAARAIGVKPGDFNQLFIAVYGDDNLVAVPLHLRWYSLPNIAQELDMVNVVIKNGLDKSMDVNQVQFQDLSELTFLSRGFKRHALGYHMAPLKWVSIIEPMYWIRPAPGCPDTVAMMENVETGLREAFHHGRVAYEKLTYDVQCALRERGLGATIFPSYMEVEQEWIAKVTGDASALTICEMAKASITFTPLPPGNKVENFERDLNWFAPNIGFCSARTAAKTEWEPGCIVVNCTGAKKSKWVRGPASWKDFEGKMWPYTMSAILDAQRGKMSEDIAATDVVFVCGNGYAVSPICAALMAVATRQYCIEDIIVRLRTIGNVLDLNTYPGGCVQYFLQCVPQEGKMAQVGSSLQSSFMHQGFELGQIRVIHGDLSMEMALRMPYVVGPHGGWGNFTTKNLDQLFASLEKCYAELLAKNTKLTLYFEKMTQKDVAQIVSFVKQQGFYPKATTVEQLKVFADAHTIVKTAKPFRGVVFRKNFLSPEWKIGGENTMATLSAESLLPGNLSASAMKTLLSRYKRNMSCHCIKLALKIYVLNFQMLNDEVLRRFENCFQEKISPSLLSEVLMWLNDSVNHDTQVDSQILDRLDITRYTQVERGFNLDPEKLNMNVHDGIIFTLREHFCEHKRKYDISKIQCLGSFIFLVLLDRKLSKGWELSETSSLFSRNCWSILTNYKEP
ncbi:Polyprotein [Tomato necrotic dwarf virus]|uniref:polyprotein n=2 Tax=Tomato necrotic dwarf virus TaxID=1481465 RepID=UPI0006CAA6BB|nr:polyprotein [Tomato necrotic dwarf virus]AHU86525.1 Polyprotein [Tomato necrotic dwarf virus]